MKAGQLFLFKIYQKVGNYKNEKQKNVIFVAGMYSDVFGDSLQ